MSSIKTYFTRQILQWHSEHFRPMPWKGEKDPYKIWLSEIMLQQTRVAQGMPYYQKFLKRFPDVYVLANASMDEVMKQWEGLGYYSRARHLHASAKLIVKHFDGHLPASYKELIRLPGIGPYTASAIASFAYGIPSAVVDGNVHRILSRYFAINKLIDNSKNKQLFTALANQLIDRQQAAAYNQAIMDFGADVCLAKNPNCKSCILEKHCQAYRSNTVNHLPPPRKRIKKRNRFFHYLIIINEGKTFIRKRTEQDIWKNLWEFPMIETTELKSFKSILAHKLINECLPVQQFELIKQSRIYKQQLTHQNINAVFYMIKSNNQIARAWQPVDSKSILNFAFPGIIHSFLSEKTLHLLN